MLTLLIAALLSQTPTVVKGPLVLKGLAADPASPANGWMYYNSTSQRFRCYLNSRWVDCTGADITPQEVSISDNGNGTKATANLDPVKETIKVSCADSDGCLVSLQETSAYIGKRASICSSIGDAGVVRYPIVSDVFAGSQSVSLSDTTPGSCFSIIYNTDSTSNQWFVSGIGINDVNSAGGTIQHVDDIEWWMLDNTAVAIPLILYGGDVDTPTYLAIQDADATRFKIAAPLTGTFGPWVITVDTGTIQFPSTGLEASGFTGESFATSVGGLSVQSGYLLLSSVDIGQTTLQGGTRISTTANRTQMPSTYSGVTHLGLFLYDVNSEVTTNNKIHSFKNHNNYTDSNEYTTSFACQTTDATQTTCTSWGLGVATPRSCFFETKVTASIDSTGTSTAGYRLDANIYRTSGNAIIAGQNATSTFETNASWDAAYTVTGTTARVSVTGVAATTINWVGYLEVHCVVDNL